MTGTSATSAADRAADRGGARADGGDGRVVVGAGDGGDLLVGRRPAAGLLGHGLAVAEARRRVDGGGLAADAEAERGGLDVDAGGLRARGEEQREDEDERARMARWYRAAVRRPLRVRQPEVHRGGWCDAVVLRLC